MRLAISCSSGLRPTFSCASAALVVASCLSGCALVGGDSYDLDDVAGSCTLSGSATTLRIATTESVVTRGGIQTLVVQGDTDIGVRLMIRLSTRTAGASMYQGPDTLNSGAGVLFGSKYNAEVMVWVGDSFYGQATGGSAQVTRMLQGADGQPVIEANFSDIELLGAGNGLSGPGCPLRVEKLSIRADSTKNQHTGTGSARLPNINGQNGEAPDSQ